jgi:hypothetical protein
MNPFVHTWNLRLKCNTCFRLSHILLQHIAASLGHHQLYTLLLILSHCHLRMSRVNALFLILKSLNVHKIDDSATLHLVVRCGCFACLLRWCVDINSLLMNSQGLKIHRGEGGQCAPWLCDGQIVC